MPAGEPVVIAGEHGHHPGPVAGAHRRDDATGSVGDVGAGHRLEIGTDQPRPRRKADERPGAHAPDLGRLGVGQGQVGGDLRSAVGRLGLLARTKRGRRSGRTHTATQCPQVGAKPAPGGRRGTAPVAQHRSTTEGRSTTSALSSRPTVSAKAPSREAAKRNALARPRRRDEPRPRALWRNGRPRAMPVGACGARSPSPPRGCTASGMHTVRYDPCGGSDR